MVHKLSEIVYKVYESSRSQPTRFVLFYDGKLKLDVGVKRYFDPGILNYGGTEKNMEIGRLLDFLKTAEQLKCNTRHSYTSSGRLESVAEHSWRLALMAMLVGDEFPELDMDKVIKMCLIHDMGEAITGDIPAFEKTDKDRKVEIKRWSS